VVAVILKGFVFPGLPQSLLTPKQHSDYQNIHDAILRAGEEIKELKPDVILIYSTMWPSVLGHQVQIRKDCKWVHVDEEFHDLGKIKYHFKMDQDLGLEVIKAGRERGLHMKPVDYEGFPIDTGSVVALSLANPTQIPALIFSSNVYADRAETVVLAKAALDALKAQNKKAVVIVISTLSNRLHQNFIDPKNDKIHSLKDEEWNQKILEFLKKGRLEDVAQLSRQIQREARVKKVNNFKPFWWLSTIMGNHNKFQGEVYAYGTQYGTGSAVIGLTPSDFAARDLEFDEDSPDQYLGERNVLADEDFLDESVDAEKE
jgi:2-aminophenol/2-amino-5-chlorophenol 1,6-dioxygenase subunit alpha